MPHIADYEAALERIGIDPRDYATISLFQNALREKIGAITKGYESGFTQVYRDIVVSFPALGIKTITYTYMEKLHVRYVIPGMPGLWGYRRASEIAEEQSNQ